MIACSPKAVSPPESTVEETNSRDDADWVNVVLRSLENNFLRSVLKSLFPRRMYVRLTCGNVVCEHPVNHRSHAASSREKLPRSGVLRAHARPFFFDLQDSYLTTTTQHPAQVISTVLPRRRRHRLSRSSFLSSTDIDICIISPGSTLPTHPPLEDGGTPPTPRPPQSPLSQPAKLLSYLNLQEGLSSLLPI